MGTFARAGASPATDAGATAASPEPPAAVLLVDDRVENLVALEATLAPLAAAHAVRLLRARSAEEALRHALAEGDRLAVALLDVDMPGTDGPETARLIRARRKTEHVPVLFVTALGEDRRRVTAAYQSGAVDYVTKPYDPDVLCAKVAAFVGLHRQRQAARAVERRRFADQVAARTAHATAVGEARLRVVLETLPDAVAVLDPQGRCAYLNPAAAALLHRVGIDPATASGRVLWELIPALVGGAYDAGLELREALASRAPQALEGFCPSLAAWYDVRVIPGPEHSLTLWLRDVTARRDAEHERERLLQSAEAARADAEAARAEAERANTAKSRFLATMSHEIRTPLNAIGGHVQLVELGVHGPVTDAQREALARVERAHRHLLSLVNDVLDLARLESGRVEYRLQSIALAEALREAASMVAPQAAAKGLALDVRTPEGASVQVWADAERLRQVLLNLLSNAVKFTARGGVRVEVAEGASDAERLDVRVIDSGVGIPADQLGRVFEPFFQAEAGRGRPSEGTGLGLAISRDLARGMGGELGAESAVGAGSTFTLTLRRLVSAEGEPVDRRERG